MSYTDSKISRERRSPRVTDRVIVELGERSEGIVRRCDLVAERIPPHAIQHRVQSGFLTVLFPGVYSVGGRPRSDEARRIAAAWAVRGAVSHEHAAMQHGIWRRRVAPDVVDVVLDRAHRGLPGLQPHRTCTLGPRDVIILPNRMAITAIPRTIIDVGETLTAYQVANVMYRAAFNRALDMGALVDAIVRNNGRQCMGVVRDALAFHLAGSAGTRSDFEDHAVGLLLRASYITEHFDVNIHLPTGDRPVEGDIIFRTSRVVVELDGGQHRLLSNSRTDADKRTLLRAAGWRVLVFHPADVYGDPISFVDAVARALR